jgi:hypothetical protein
VRRQILSLSLLVVLMTLTLLPPLFGYLPTTPAVARASPITPGPNDLNASTPLVNYEDWTPANPAGNSSLVDVLVQLVNASDIGECKDGDLTIHTFSVIFAGNESVVFEDNLEYVSGSGWAAFNYSLLQWNLQPDTYKIRCFFERNTGVEIWNTTTANSLSFVYNHRLTIAVPDYTYIADTSDTIDVVIEYIASTLWGIVIEANTTLIFQNAENTSISESFTNVLQYNVSSTYWEVDELNISILVSGESYKIICTANYMVKVPSHAGISPPSDAFTFRGPYLRIAQPHIIYVGRDIQTLNITVDWVWHSVFGYLNDTEVSLSNFSIYLATGTGGSLVNGTLNWNSTGANWYFAPLNVSYYVGLGNLSIGEFYNVSAFFISVERSGRPAVQNLSPFSKAFIIDFDPPSIDKVTTNPSSPEDYQWVVITGEISDDALIDTVILSYYNGSQWINVTMLGTPGKQANFTASIPPFPERHVVEYLIYVNDTQNVWTNVTIQYTVADTLPVISFIHYLPTNPRDIDIVTINTTITDGTGVQTVLIHYTYDGITWVTLEMNNIGGSVYQASLPQYPQLLSSFEFRCVLFFIEATDVYANTRESAYQAYQVRGSLPSIDPATSLLILAVIGLAGVALILLYKVYERY